MVWLLPVVCCIVGDSSEVRDGQMDFRLAMAERARLPDAVRVVSSAGLGSACRGQL